MNFDTWFNKSRDIKVLSNRKELLSISRDTLSSNEMQEYINFDTWYNNKFLLFICRLFPNYFPNFHEYQMSQNDDREILRFKFQFQN